MMLATGLECYWVFKKVWGMHGCASNTAIDAVLRACWGVCVCVCVSTGSAHYCSVWHCFRLALRTATIGRYC